MALNENHYQSLLVSLQHVRNRIIFFILFCIYTLLSVLATTDKTIYMQEAIKMPLINIDLPLIAFYITIPLFLTALQFNLLYTMYSYKKILYKGYAKYNEDVKSLPKGLFEGVLLYSNKSLFFKIVKFFLFIIIFIFPIAILTIFYLRFTDYQHFGISSWHFVLIVLSVVLLFVFRNLLVSFHSNKYSKSTRWFEYALTIIFLISLSYYHYKIVYRVSKETFSAHDKQYLDNFYKKIKNLNIHLEEILYPRLKINGEILIPHNKDLLEVLSVLKENNNHKLLLFNQSERNFRSAIFNNCIMTKTNFKNSKMEYANLSDADLQNSNLNHANLQESTLKSINLKNANLENANLQGANLKEANLQGTNFKFANLQGSDLSEVNLKGAYLAESYLQGAYLFETNLQGTYLFGVNLQGAYLEKANLQGAYFYVTNLKSVLSNKRISFKKLYNHKSDLSGINKQPLTDEEVSQIKKIVKSSKYFDEDEKKLIDESLKNAVGKNPIEWLKTQNIIIGKLTPEEIEEISKTIVSKKARERMGLDIADN